MTQYFGWTEVNYEVSVQDVQVPGQAEESEDERGSVNALSGLSHFL